MMSKRVKQTQVCRLCHEEKTLDLFERDKRVKGGVTTRCKSCKAGLNDKARTLYSRLKGRAKNDNRPLEVSLKQLRGLLAAFDGKCVYCNATEEDTGLSHHVDHVIATSKGGRHHISNLVVACDPCNRQKGNRTFLEFYKTKKDVISDENYAAILHYTALFSGQPLSEVFEQFLADYIKENYSPLVEILGDEFDDEIKRAAEIKIKTERAS